MALDEKDLELLGGFIEKKLAAFTEDLAGKAAESAVTSRVATVGAPDVDPEAGPKYYVHLADGSVVESYDSASTHMANADGTQVAVIGRYQMGAGA
jgi:hypothetical protein